MTFTDVRLVRSLDDVGIKDAGQSGSKAATLGDLKRAGFPVPEGVVVTTEALAQALALAGLDAAAAGRRTLRQRRFPPTWLPRLPPRSNHISCHSDRKSRTAGLRLKLRAVEAAPRPT